MSPTIWATDPTGNNNPFLKITNPALFVMGLSASFSGLTWQTPAQVWWSENAINWTQASTPADGLPKLQISSRSNLSYFNGVWVFEYEWDAGVGTNVDIVVYSYDGKNWQLGWKPTGANLSAGVWFMDVLTNSGANTITLDNNNFVSPPNRIIIPISVQNPSGQPNKIAFGDSIYSSNILVDPAQGGGSLTFSGSEGAYALNPLPVSITAVRLRAVPSEQAEEVAFDYTNTPISQTIVNGGADMPGASWTTSFDQAGESGTLNTQLFYGFPSGSGF